ncbi:unnamed protein product [Symbiodinium sp. CCMP2592]|nr:unnamed protein product [Symbiodinium sp. CCMP2592]
MNVVLPRVSEMRKHVGELLLQRGARGAVGEEKARLLLDIAQYSDAVMLRVINDAEHKRVAEAVARLPEGTVSFGPCAMSIADQLHCRDLETVSDAESESQQEAPAVAASAPKRRRTARHGGPRGLRLSRGRAVAVRSFWSKVATQVSVFAQARRHGVSGACASFIIASVLRLDKLFRLRLRGWLEASASRRVKQLFLCVQCMHTARSM